MARVECSFLPQDLLRLNDATILVGVNLAPGKSCEGFVLGEEGVLLPQVILQKEKLPKLTWQIMFFFLFHDVFFFVFVFLKKTLIFASVGPSGVSAVRNVRMRVSGCW